MDIKFEKENSFHNSESKIIDTVIYNGKYINADIFKKRALSVAAAFIGIASVVAVILF